MSALSETSSDLPLTEVTYFILLSLSTGPLHGYAIMKDVRALSQERVILSTGTLYGALKRLLELGWIANSPDSANGLGGNGSASSNGSASGLGSASGRVRKAYRLTAPGRRVLSGEVERLEGLVAAAQLRRPGPAADQLS